MLIINRKKWYRGKEAGSALRRKRDGRMCCLGFDSIRRGFTAKEITGIGTPAEIGSPDGLLFGSTSETRKILRARLRGLVYQGLNTKICNKMMNVNDDSELSDKDRESKLKKLFAKIGIRVKFIN